MKIYNIRLYPNGLPVGVIKCDRGTDWGNPFIMKGEKDRDTVWRAKALSPINHCAPN